MRIFYVVAVMAAVILVTNATADEMSWSNGWLPFGDSTLTKRSAETKATEAKAAETAAETQADAKETTVEGRNYQVHEPIYSNDTDINVVIDEIINSRREGRNLGEFDQVYADANIDQALQQGNDMQARNLIRDKLCGLGLMSCDVEEKRPFYSTIYAQGPPPPNFGGGGPYGPPRPMPPPGYFNSRPPPSSLNSFGPPQKAGFNGPFGGSKPSGFVSNYNGPFLESPPPSAIDNSGGPTFSKPPPGAIIYESKPPGPIYTGNSDIPPYNFESNAGEKIEIAPGGLQSGNFYTQQSASSAASASNVIVGNAADLAGAATSAGLQQHVHHHYHHVEGADAIGAKVPSVPIPIGGGQIINTDFSTLAQSSATFTPQTHGGITQTGAFEAGFNGASHGGLLTQGASAFGSGGGIQKPNGEYYKPSASLGGGINQGLGSSGFGQSGFSQSTGSFHSQNPDYYKKELQNFGGITTSASNYNGISAGYGGSGGGQFQGGFETARQQIVDCQCVPYNQCPAADRIGRKEDLILPIDPRNLGKDIEALSDDAAANVTASANAEANDKKDESKTQDDKTRSKRQTGDEAAVTAEDKKSDDDNSDLPLDAQGRDLPTLQALELLQRKILPTYGVSFGLPTPSNGYPPNALGEYYPAQNPHFGSIGPNGLNLGLLNVNPLVSVQVSKTEYGDKVVKPLVNLHVTPNANILQRVGDLFKRHPEVIENTHYHHHEHFSGFEHDHHSNVLTGPGPLEHHPSVEHYPHTGPGVITEILPSKPIFEYHSSNAVPIHHFEHHPHPHESIKHYESSDHTSFGHTSFAHQQHISEPLQYHPDTTSSTGYGGEHSHGISSGFDHSGFANNYVGSGSGGGGGGYENFYERSSNVSQVPLTDKGRRGKQLQYHGIHQIPTQAPGYADGSDRITFPRNRRRRSIETSDEQDSSESVSAGSVKIEQRAYYGNRPVEKTCRVNEVCCRRPFRPQPPSQQFGRCGVRNAAGITGRIKNPVYVDGDSEFGEYPWHVAILKKDPKESIYACGGTLIDAQHVISAAHCIKSQNGFDLRVRLGEWDVNHDVEFFPYIERNVVSVHIHPEYYAGTLDNDLAVLKLDSPVDFSKNPHISPACLPEKFSDFTGARCWTTGWGKDAFGEQGKYQNILKEVDVPILSHHQCESQLRQTRLGYSYKLNPGFVCAGGEEGKDACKGDGGGPLVCERNGIWSVVGVVSWGIGCGQVNVPGVYVRVAHYLDWIRQITQYYK